MTVLSNLGQKVILIFAFLALLLLSIASLFIRTNLPMDGSELAHMQVNGPLFWIALLAFVPLILILLRLASRLKEQSLFGLGTLFYLLLSLYLILHQNDVIRHDALATLDAARAVSDGNYSPLNQVMGYLYKYPHQLGLVSFERIILGSFGTDTVRPFFFINAFFGIISQFFTWKISQRLFRNPQVSKYCLTLSFLFLPHLFFILFVYGLTFSLPFALAGCYFLQGYLDRSRTTDLMLSISCLTLAVLLRNNNSILIVSVACVLLLDFLQKKRKKSLLFLISLLGTIWGSNRAQLAYYQQLSGVSTLTGEPKIAWVTMGLNDTPLYNRVVGWYDAYVENIYTETKGDPEQITQKSKEQLGQRLAYMAHHPDYTLRFFSKKFISTWTDGLFQSLWSGPVAKMPVEGQDTSGFWMNSLYKQGPLYYLVYGFAALFLTSLYLMLSLALFDLLKQKTIPLALLLPLLYLLGGILFHLVWETKSQYVYPYVYFLLPLAAYGFTLLDQRLTSRLKQPKKN